MRKTWWESVFLRALPKHVGSEKIVHYNIRFIFTFEQEKRIGSRGTRTRDKMRELGDSSRLMAARR